MGSLVGHSGPGFGFLLLGLWHLFNHIKLYSLKPSSYYALPWFPTSKLHRLELYLVLFGSLASIVVELFIGPSAHQPFDSDGSIPSYHLHNFEHASISLSLLVYAAFAIALDRARARLRHELTLLLAAAAFSQQLLIFHLHSADHMGVEGQYHWLLQLVIAVSLGTTVAGIARPRSFMVSFVRSGSIALQGVWFLVTGCMLYTPGLIAKGCYLNREEGHSVVRCRSEEALHRAKSLVNLQFSWCMTAMAVLCMLLYFWVPKVFSEELQYTPWVKEMTQEEEGLDLESNRLMESESFIHTGKGFKAIELER